MKRQPDVRGLEFAAEYFANLMPNFSRMPIDEQERARSALRIVANTTLVLRAELGDACPACGIVVGEGIAHG